MVFKNKIKNAWSDIDVQLKRRYSLIPNLVDSVKGYATHEKSLFENVAKYRSEAENATGIKEQEIAENNLIGLRGAVPGPKKGLIIIGGKA